MMPLLQKSGNNTLVKWNKDIIRGQFLFRTTNCNNTNKNKRESEKRDGYCGGNFYLVVEINKCTINFTFSVSMSIVIFLVCRFHFYAHLLISLSYLCHSIYGLFTPFLCSSSSFFFASFHSIPHLFFICRVFYAKYFEYECVFGIQRRSLVTKERN